MNEPQETRISLPTDGPAKPFDAAYKPGQKLTIITISEMMAHTVKRLVTVKTVLPTPERRASYVNGPLHAWRCGTHTPQGKRKEFYLDIRPDDLVFDGWAIPFKIDSEAERAHGDGIFIIKVMSGNACLNLAGECSEIKRWVETKNLNLPLLDSTKAKILVIPIDANGCRLSDDDGELLYPEIETDHAVVNRLKGDNAR